MRTPHRLALLLLGMLLPVVALAAPQQVPNPLNAPATSTAGDPLCVAGSNSQQTNTCPSGIAATKLSGTIDSARLPTSGATAGTYGDATHCINATVDAKGRLTAVSNATSCPGAGVSSITAGAGLGTAAGTCASGSITTSGTLLSCMSMVAKTADYTLVNGDNVKIIVFNCSSTCTATIPQATSSGNFAVGWTVNFINRGAGSLVLSPQTSVINGIPSARQTLTTNQWASIASDGTNYVGQYGGEKPAGIANLQGSLGTIGARKILGNATSGTADVTATGYTASSTDGTLAAVHGTIVSGNCPQFTDTVGTVIDSGAPCGGSGGGITALTGDVTAAGTSSVAATVAKINGTSVPASPSTHQVPVVTASNVSTWKTIPDCQDTIGKHLNYTQSGDTFSCGTSVPVAGVLYSLVTPVATGSGLTEQILGTYSLPANTLGTDGYIIRVHGIFATAANANQKSARCYFAGIVTPVVLLTTASRLMFCDFTIVRTGTDTQSVIASSIGNVTGNPPTYTAASEDDGAGITIKGTCQDAANSPGDCALVSFTVELVK